MVAWLSAGTGPCPPPPDRGGWSTTARAVSGPSSRVQGRRFRRGSRPADMSPNAPVCAGRARGVPRAHLKFANRGCPRRRVRSVGDAARAASLTSTRPQGPIQAKMGRSCSTVSTPSHQRKVYDADVTNQELSNNGMRVVEPTAALARADRVSPGNWELRLLSEYGLVLEPVTDEWRQNAQPHQVGFVAISAVDEAGRCTVCAMVVPALDQMERDSVAERLYTRIARLREYGPEPDRWQPRSDGGWQLYIGRCSRASPSSGDANASCSGHPQEFLNAAAYTDAHGPAPARAGGSQRPARADGSMPAADTIV